MTNALTTPIDQDAHPDHYALFTDIPRADRDIWVRTRSYVTAQHARMVDAWDRAHYPTDVVPELGQLGLLTDGGPSP